MEKNERQTLGKEELDRTVKLALSPDSGFICADYAPHRVIVRVHHADKDTYDVLYESCICSAYASYTYKEGQRLHEIAESVCKICEYSPTYGAHEILYPNAITVKKHPLYLAATENGDEYLKADIAVHYGIASEKDYELLYSYDGLYRLPALSVEYNMKYCVKRNTIDTELLMRSGYQINRMARMAMGGKTHDAWSLNPHTKHGVDAAPVSIDGITFEEYLKLFHR